MTANAPINPVPVIVTTVPPLASPLAGEMALIVGGRTAYVNWSAGDIALVPKGVVTVTLTVPTAPAGEMVAILVAFTTVKLETGVVPKFTAVVPVNPVPVIVTRVPPNVFPFAGEMPVTFGTGGRVCPVPAVYFRSLCVWS